MSRDVCFHQMHGSNVVLDKNGTVAMWHSVKSGGSIFSDTPVSPGENITIHVEGSGRLYVGFITENPFRFKNNVPDPISELSSFEIMDEIRFHKKSCSLLMSLNKEGIKVTSSVRDVKYSKTLDRETVIWIAIYVQFGNVKVTLKTDDGKHGKFSTIHGMNIDMDVERTMASMIDPNPAAVCAIKPMIGIGESLLLRSEPLKNNNKTASYFSLKLMVSPTSPEQNGALDAREPPVAQSTAFTVIENLQKRDCHGDIRITLKSEKIIEYSTANNKINSQSLNFIATSGIWIYFELYRVSVNCYALVTPDFDIGLPDFTFTVTQENTMSNDNIRDSYETGSGKSHHHAHVWCGNNSSLPTLKPGKPSYARCISEQLESPISRSNSPYELNPDYYLEVIAQQNVLATSASCPTRLNNLCTNESRERIMEKLTSLESKVDTLGKHFRFASLSPKDNGNEPYFSSLSEKTREAPKTDQQNNTSVFGDLVDLRDTIKRNWVQLLNTLQTGSMCDYLYQNDFMSQQECDRILQRVKSDQQDANRMLLLAMSKKKISKRLLIQILTDIGDAHLIHVLLQ